MSRFTLLSTICLLLSISSFAQKNKDQSGPNDHLIKKNLLVDGNISSAGGKNLVLQTNQATQITVLDANGYVGMDITNPQERLHINGSIRGNSSGGALRVNTEHGWLDMGPQDGQSVHLSTVMSRFLMNQPLWVDGAFSSYGTRNLEFQTNGNTRITILDDSGFVGIGMTNPSERLEVAGNAKVSETITGKDLVSETLTTTEGKFDGNVEINQNLNVNGLVGLGVANPTERLEVEGNIKVSDEITTTSLISETGIFTQDVEIGGNVQVSNNTIINGRLGVGVAAPIEKVEVAGNVKVSDKITATDVEATNGVFSDRVSVVNDIILGGNLGVGVESPTERLEVEGNAIISETLTTKNLDAEQLSLSGDFTVEGNSSVAQDAYVGGQMGIGVEVPTEKLDVAGNIKSSNKIIATNVEAVNGVFSEGITVTNNVNVGGNLGIGTNDTRGFKLAVAGEIVVEEITVDLEADWPDYVFASDYELTSLEETAAFINEHQHLPEIPSAEEVEANGVQLGKLNILLLKKVEEMMLHLIEKDKEINWLKSESKLLKQRINKLEIND